MNIKVKPIITEKSLQDARSNRFTFRVPEFATKVEIKNAVSELFGVDVKSVSTMKYKSIERRNAYRNRLTSKAFKKAIVSLAKDQKIEVFSEKK